MFHESQNWTTFFALMVLPRGRLLRQTTLGRGCEALQQLVTMIPSFCFTYPGLEHMEERIASEVDGKFLHVCSWRLKKLEQCSKMLQHEL